MTDGKNSDPADVESPESESTEPESTEPESTEPEAAASPDEEPPAGPTDAEELLANALRAHAARAALPVEPDSEPPDTDPESTDRESTETVSPVPENANERTQTTAPAAPWPPETRDRMLAPHNVDSRLEISLEIEAGFGPGHAARPGTVDPGAADPNTAEPDAEPDIGSRTISRRAPVAVPGPLPARWILLLAVLLGLAAGTVAGLLSVL